MSRHNRTPTAEKPSLRISPYRGYTPTAGSSRSEGSADGTHLSCRRFCLVGFSALVVLLTWTAPAHAVDYYVAPNGNDSSPGSLAQPWLTLTRAAAILQAGDTAYVRAGTYAPVTLTRSGSSASALISFVAYPGEAPIVEGSLGSCRGGIFDLGNHTNIRISGFELRNCPNGFGIGTWDTSTVGTMIFENNHIHHNVAGDNAAGISITRSLGTITMRNNLIHDNDGTNPNNCHGIVIFSDIVGFKDIRVQNNEIYNEGVPVKYKHPSWGGTSTFDCSYNLIHDNFGRNAIESTEADSRIHHNVLYNVTTGIAMFGDSAVPTSAIIHHNSLYNAVWAIRVLGGYTGVQIRDNILGVHSVAGSPYIEDRGFGLWLEQTATTQSDYNLYTPGFSAANWGGYGPSYTLAQLQAAGLDAHSTEALPQYVSPPTDLHLQSGSPARGRSSTGGTIGAYETGNEIIGIISSGAPPSNRCDLNNSGGQPNVTDVQLCTNQAIGIASCSTGDINLDSQCNVIDVQRVVNAALGGPCVTQ